MKCIMIVYNSAIEDVVHSALSGIVEKYSLLDKITGKGKNSVPHLGDNIWPAINKMMITIVNDDVVAKVKSALAPVKENYISEGLKLFVLPVEELI